MSLRDETEARVKALVDAGRLDAAGYPAVKRIAAELGHSAQYVRVCLKRLGIALNHPGFRLSPDDVWRKAELVRLYRAGASYSEIADATGLTFGAVKSAVARARLRGEPVRPRRGRSGPARPARHQPADDEIEARIAEAREAKRRAILAGGTDDHRGRPRA